ncbi:MAG: sigma-70 family RNA polymerase sigma factor [Lachnospiraceae bacterium]|nr:sigma-70 family RNA polymerase sigma factor [Candidatus Colinaster equi]
MTVTRKWDMMSDEELIESLRAGNQEVGDYICEKYKNLVRSKAKSMYILGAEPEDLIQEGMIGLFKAMRDYDASSEASFYTFAMLCITRQIYKAVQASNRKKAMPLNTYVSVYAGEDEPGEASIDEMLACDGLNPEETLIDKENVELLEQSIAKELSSFEKQVLELHITGMGYVDIARVLGRDEKSTDNALQRSKSKIKKILSM